MPFFASINVIRNGILGSIYIATLKALCNQEWNSQIYIWSYIEGALLINNHSGSKRLSEYAQVKASPKGAGWQKSSLFFSLLHPRLLPTSFRLLNQETFKFRNVRNFLAIKNCNKVISFDSIEA